MARRIAHTLEDAGGDPSKLATVEEFLADPVMKDVTDTTPLPITALTLKKRVEVLEAQIKVFVRIATAEDYERVAQYGLEANRIIKEATDFYAPEVQELHKLWKSKTEERASIIDPAEAVKDLARRLTGEWAREQERLRLEEQRRLEEEERQKAEEERMAEAKALERAGRMEEAQAMIEGGSEVEVAPVMVPSYVPKVSGVSKPRDNFQVEVTDLRALAGAVVEGKVPLNAIEGNLSWLNAQARNMKGILAYPGIKVRNLAKAAFRS